MDIIIFPNRLRGTITPPPSKSLAHRMILIELLAGKKTFSIPASLSDDIRATVLCATALTKTCGSGGLDSDTLPILNCENSGSTLRFMIPITLFLRQGGVFTGGTRLMNRPTDTYRKLFMEKGVMFHQVENCLTVRGRLEAGEYLISGDISSQFATGLLFVLPLISQSSIIRFNTTLLSTPYVEITQDVLRKCGILIRWIDSKTILIPGSQQYNVGEITLEADWSQAAFWYAANFVGNEIKIEELNPISIQGDKIVEQWYNALKSKETIEVNLSNNPDLLPPLSVMAARRKSITKFTHVNRLRYKESDRLKSIKEMLASFGVSVRIGYDFLEVYGNIAPSDNPIIVNSFGDHRIVMAAAVLSSIWKAPVTILGADSVNKSYPKFFQDFSRLGGEVYVL